MATKKKTSKKSKKRASKKAEVVEHKTSSGPRTLNQQLIDEVCKYVTLGSYVETAAAACGIDRVTFYRWLKQGKKDRNAGRNATQQAILSQRLLEALGKSELRDIIRIDQAGEKDWRASAWRLERRQARRWGSKAAVKIEDGDQPGFKDEENIHAQLADMVNEIEGANSADAEGFENEGADGIHKGNR